MPRLSRRKWLSSRRVSGHRVSRHWRFQESSKLLFSQRQWSNFRYSGIFLNQNLRHFRNTTYIQQIEIVNTIFWCDKFCDTYKVLPKLTTKTSQFTSPINVPQKSINMKKCKTKHDLEQCKERKKKKKGQGRLLQKYLCTWRNVEWVLVPYCSWLHPTRSSTF